MNALQVSYLGLVFVVACASHARPAAATRESTDLRCRTINDSLVSLSSLEALPEGGFLRAGVYRAPRLPTKTPKGTQVIIRYVAQPDGTPDSTALEIIGIQDARFREEAMKTIRSMRLGPAIVDGCSARSRVDVYLTKG